MADPGWVEMTHPDVGDDEPPAVVTEEAFEGLWKDKGWKRVDAPTAQTPARESRTRAGSTESEAK